MINYLNHKNKDITMKKSVIIFSAVLFSILLTSLVLAAVPIYPAPGLPATSYGPFGTADTGLASVVKGALSGLSSTIAYILGGAGMGDIAFSKLLMFILLTAVFFIPAKGLAPNNTSIGVIISIIAAILGVYWIPNEMVSSILLPYSAVGIVITVMVPLIALVWLFERQITNRTLARAGLVFTAFAFFTLWLFRLNDPKVASDPSSVIFLMSYPTAAVVCLVMAFVDRWIQAKLLFAVMGNNKRARALVRISDLTDLVKKDEAARLNFPPNSPQYATLTANINQNNAAIALELKNI